MAFAFNDDRSKTDLSAYANATTTQNALNLKLTKKDISAIDPPNIKRDTTAITSDIIYYTVSIPISSIPANSWKEGTGQITNTIKNLNGDNCSISGTYYPMGIVGIALFDDASGQSRNGCLSLIEAYIQSPDFSNPYVYVSVKNMTSSTQNGVAKVTVALLRKTVVNP